MKGIMKKQTQPGFTIVELLIVIVVIGILAAITIVAYNGIQGRANDAAIKSDLSSIAKKIQFYKVDQGVYPVGAAQLGTLDLQVTKSAYGNHYMVSANAYNLLYCRNNTSSPNQFGLVAYSKSGNSFQYTNGQVSDYTDPKVGSATTCSSLGIDIGTSRDYFYDQGAWHAYAGG